MEWIVSGQQVKLNFNSVPTHSYDIYIFFLSFIDRPQPFNYGFHICLLKLSLSSEHPLSFSLHDIGWTKDKLNFKSNTEPSIKRTRSVGLLTKGRRGKLIRHFAFRERLRRFVRRARHSAVSSKSTLCCAQKADLWGFVAAYPWKHR